MENHTVRTIEVADEGLCMLQCYLEPNCVSYNFCKIKQASGKHKCDLNSATIEHDEDLVKYESCIYRQAEVRMKLLSQERDILRSVRYKTNNPLSSYSTHLLISSSNRPN